MRINLEELVISSKVHRKQQILIYSLKEKSLVNRIIFDMTFAFD